MIGSKALRLRSSANDLNGKLLEVYLPRLEQPIEVCAESSPAPVTVRGWETILLVEDADALRKLAQMFLRENGYQVLVAANGTEAQQLARQHGGPIHLLLTDVVMPGINGRMLAERLAPFHPGMRVLYMSGYTDSFIAGHGVLEAGTHLLHKPFTEETLTRRVRLVLDSNIDAANASGTEQTPTDVFDGADVQLKR